MHARFKFDNAELLKLCRVPGYNQCSSISFVLHSFTHSLPSAHKWGRKSPIA